MDEARDHYRCSVKLYNDVRALLQSKDVWKITFRNAHQHACTALWRTLARLEKTDEALCAAEQGRAQTLRDLMVFQYDSELQAPKEFVPKETISDILTDLCTQTVFVALESNTIYLWLLKGIDIHFNKECIKEATLLMEKAFEEIGVRARVKCENRSLRESEGELPLRTILCTSCLIL